MGNTKSRTLQSEKTCNFTTPQQRPRVQRRAEQRAQVAMAVRRFAPIREQWFATTVRDSELAATWKAVPPTTFLAGRDHHQRNLPETPTTVLAMTEDEHEFDDFSRAFLESCQQQQQAHTSSTSRRRMPFEVKALPYAKDALEPHVSAETVDTHYERHHKGYAAKLTQLTEGKPEASMALEDIVRSAAAGPVFNNAAQMWNHTFYWECMRPAPKEEEGGPAGALAAALEKSFGSVAAFQKAFLDRAAAHFGSGWVWLVQRPADGGLEIWDGHDAANPLRAGLRPLLTVDVWEHAYYIDRRNRRAEYLEHWWPLVNWAFVAAQLQQ